MSERGYFDLRFLIPAYTFLMFVVAVNFVPIMTELKQQSYAGPIFGGIIVLLSGPALGFIIGQVWWWWFHRELILYDWSPVKETLIPKFKLTKRKGDDDRRNVLIVYDYVLHYHVHSSAMMKGISSYTKRRWDLYILLSTTKWSVALGLIFGAVIQIGVFVHPLYYFSLHYYPVLCLKAMIF